MNEVQYLTRDDVVALHDEIVDRMGEPYSALAQPSTLESAIARPRNAAWYEGVDLIEQAAILAIAISQSQAFVDGNKRAAYAAADVFLRINGQVFVGDPMDLARHLEAFALGYDKETRETAKTRFVGFLRSTVVPRQYLRS